MRGRPLAVGAKAYRLAELCLAASAILALARGLIRGRTLAWPSPTARAMPENRKLAAARRAVLASGDPFHNGVGAASRSIPGRRDALLPHSSSFSWLRRGSAGRLQDVALVSLQWHRAGGARAPSGTGRAHPCFGGGMRPHPPKLRSGLTEAAWRLSMHRDGTWAGRANACAAPRRRAFDLARSHRSTPSPLMTASPDATGCSAPV